MKMNIPIDIDKVTVVDGKIIIDINQNHKEWLDTFLVAKNNVKLSSLKPKDKFKIGEEEFIVLEQTESGTRVISKQFAYSNMRFGDCADWKQSPIRTLLNDEYYNKISKLVGTNNIISMERDLTSLDGLDDYGTCTDKITLLSVNEYAKYHKILDLKSNYPDWWCTITPVSTPSNDSTRGVCFVNSDGFLDWGDCAYYFGVRPFLTFDSSISVYVSLQNEIEILSRLGKKTLTSISRE